MMEPVVWELAKAGAEAGLSAFEHRSALAAMWARLTRKTYRIAVTGPEGAGKSVLVDYLQGEGFKPGYQPPGISLSVERDRVVWPRKCLSLSTLPGQQRFAQRINALQEVFDVGDPLDGIIHVVANGYLARERLRWPEIAAQEGPFESPDGQVRSQLTARERDVYFAQFCRVLEGLCHG